MQQEKIHTILNCKYPFGNKIKHTNTFAELIVEIKQQQQQKLFKKKLKLFMQFKCPSFIQIVQVSKKQQSYHLYYKYYQNSLETWIRNNFLNIDIYSQRQIVFEALSEICDLLISKGVRINLQLSQIRVSNQNILKVFVTPQFELIQDYRLLKNYYKQLKKCLDSKFLQILNQQKRLLNLKILKQKNNKTQVSRNFIIRGNKLVFLDDKQVKQPEKNNQFQSFYKAKRQSSSTANTMNGMLRAIQSPMKLSLQNLKYSSPLKNKGKTQRPNKISQKLIRSGKSLNKLCQTQRIQQIKWKTLKIKRHHEVQIQAINNIKDDDKKMEQAKYQQKEESPNLKSIFTKHQQKTPATLPQTIQHNQQANIVQKFYKKMNMCYYQQKRRASDIQSYLRSTKSKINRLFQKFQDFLQKRNVQDRLQLNSSYYHKNFILVQKIMYMEKRIVKIKNKTYIKIK